MTRLKPDADSAVAGHIFTGSARVTGATLVLNSGLFVARADTANGIDGGITVESGGTLAGEATVGDANGKFATPIIVQAGGTLIPGTLNSAVPDPACGPQVRFDTVQRPVAHAMNNAFGFGGNNCSLVFARA